MNLTLIEKYKKLFGIVSPTSQFSVKELKRRWRILSSKYHPDHGGREEHFIFVQDAYKYLKPICKEVKEKEVNSFNSFNRYNRYNRYGIGEIKVRVGKGHIYIWNIEEEGINVHA